MEPVTQGGAARFAYRLPWAIVRQPFGLKVESRKRYAHSAQARFIRIKYYFRIIPAWPRRSKSLLPLTSRRPRARPRGLTRQLVFHFRQVDALCDVGQDQRWCIGQMTSLKEEAGYNFGPRQVHGAIDAVILPGADPNSVFWRILAMMPNRCLGVSRSHSRFRLDGLLTDVPVSL